MAESDISLHDHGRAPARNQAALTYATQLILQVCHLAGTAAFIDEAGLGPDGKDLRKAIRSRNTAALFDWLVAALSYQGISDEVAKNFMDLHGLASWHVIESDLRRLPSCPRLSSYWPLRLPLQQKRVHLRRAQSPRGLSAAEILVAQRPAQSDRLFAVSVRARHR
jgi:hypothetical protein